MEGIPTRVEPTVQNTLTDLITNLTPTNSDSIRTVATKTIAELYRSSDFGDEGTIAGNSITQVVAASVYYACRVQHEPLKLNDVGCQSPASLSAIRHTYHRIVSALKLPVPPQSPELFISKIADAIDAPDQMVTAVQCLLNEASNAPATGADPAGIAAGAFYAVAAETRHADWQVTQSDLSTVTDTCLDTVRSRWKEFEPHTDIVSDLIPDSSAGAPPTVDIPNETLSPNGTTSATLTHDYGVTLDANPLTYETGATMLADVTGRLISDYGLLTAIDLPYHAPRCTRPLLVTDPTAFEFTANWKETSAEGYYVNTKLPTKAKRRRLTNLAARVDVALSFFEPTQDPSPVSGEGETDTAAESD